MSYSVTYCIYVPGKPWICFHYYCAVYDECKYSDTFWFADHTHLFVQYTISLSSLCQLIWRHWTYKMPVRYILSSVWVRLSILSLLSIIRWVGLYVFSLAISLVMIERICILSLIIIIESEVWTITQCLGLGHETMVSAVCLSIFLSRYQPTDYCIIAISNGYFALYLHWFNKQLHYWEGVNQVFIKTMKRHRDIVNNSFYSKACFLSAIPNHYLLFNKHEISCD